NAWGERVTPARRRLNYCGGRVYAVINIQHYSAQIPEGGEGRVPPRRIRFARRVHCSQYDAAAVAMVSPAAWEPSAPRVQLCLATAVLLQALLEQTSAVTAVWPAPWLARRHRTSPLRPSARSCS